LYIASEIDLRAAVPLAERVVAVLVGIRSSGIVDRRMYNKNPSTAHRLEKKCEACIAPIRDT
jgi:hypothetical protein